MTYHIYKYRFLNKVITNKFDLILQVRLFHASQTSPRAHPKVKTGKKQSSDSLGSRAFNDKTNPGLFGQTSYEETLEAGVVLGGLYEVTKSFGAVVAIQGVSFELRSGEVLALLGENGAGKSTCVKVLAGVHPPSAGHVYLEGRPVHLRSPLDAQHRGIAVMHQHPGLFGDLSIAENVFMGHPKKRFLGILDHNQMLEGTHRLLEIVGLQADPRAPLYTLRTSEQQPVAIAKALAVKARIMIMDAPTAALPRHEVDQLFP